MDQNDQAYYEYEIDPQGMEEGFFAPGMEPYQEDYEEYGQEDMGGDYSDDGFEEDFEDDGEYPEEGEARRFHVAMNVFDSTSILVGVVVILVLTALIVSMVSWLRADILHSFGMLQTSIQ